MNRPAPTDIVGSLAWIMDQIEEIKTSKGGERMSAAAAAAAMGHKPSYFHCAPWRIPEFGAKGYKHTFADWCSWVERPEAERRAEWDAMSIKDRGKARGAA